MASSTERNSPEEPNRDPFESIISAFVAYLEHAGLAGSSIAGYRGPVRHFLTWLDKTGTAIDAVDGRVTRQFLDHDCTCPPPFTNQRSGALHAGGGAAPISWCARFLEATGRTPVLGELEDSLLLLEDFMELLAGAGYSQFTLDDFRSGCRHFIVWLHHLRISIRNVDRSVLDQFLGHDCACFLPGVFRGRSDFAGTAKSHAQLKRFTAFLSARGLLPDLFPAGRMPDEGLQAFRSWLRQHRGISDRTIQRHARNVAGLLPDLGDDPARYDATLIREVLLHRLGAVSRTEVKRMTTSLRMYLRFLAANGRCPPALAGAVPTVPAWRLAALPRYIPMEDIERTIASYDPATRQGVRDRAILLLLARLALRAGDVLNLRLTDIDWDNARLRVCGKSKRETTLPLPQDAGDALLEYLRTARPRVDEQRVFLRLHAPYRPLSDSGRISAVVRRALDRAGVATAGSRGAHLIRHSVATGLLRSGATPEVVGALLRHRSPESTALYAKVDANMLRRVAQPWIGAVPCR